MLKYSSVFFIDMVENKEKHVIKFKRGNYTFVFDWYISFFLSNKFFVSLKFLTSHCQNRGYIPEYGR